MKKPVVLRILKGPQVVGVKQFLDPQIIIGRSSTDSDIQLGLDGESVSIIHASIEEREEGQYFVSDLGSIGGTLLNNALVLDSSIQSGDVLTIGDYQIEFFIGAPKPKTGTTAPGIAAQPQRFEQAETPVPPTVTMPPAKPTTPPPSAAPPAPPVPSAPAPPPMPPSVPSAAPTSPAQPVAPPTPTSAPPPPAPAEPPRQPAMQEQRRSGPQIIVPVRPPNAGAPPAPPQAFSTSTTPTSSSFGKPMSPPPGAGPQAGPGSINKKPSIQSATGMAGPGIQQPFAIRKGPANRSEQPGKRRWRHRGPTFAPPSKYGDVRDFVRPSKGTIVEVLVAWGERVIASHHFSTAGTVTIGSHPDNNIVIPILSASVRKLPILQIDNRVVVLVSGEMRGELIRGQTSSSLTELMRQNRLVKAGAGQAVALEQGEMIRLEIAERLAILIRYVSDSPKPLGAPLLDLTASETTGVVLALALVATLWLYMFLYQSPNPLPSDEDKEPLRTALIVLTPPTPAPLPKVEPTPAATPEPVVVQPTPVATPLPRKVVAAKETKATEKKAVKVTNLTRKQDNGKSASAAPNPNKTGPHIRTSVKQGGAIKTAQHEGSQMQSKSRDMSKAGVFSVFGGGGAQNKLSGSTTGSGELAGMAAQANGRSGSQTDRAGEGLGSELKDTGVGGNGKSLEGIAGGVSTQGRGSGNAGYGTGGLGNRQGVKIVTGGTGEEITGTIDRDAIRRVIQANLRSIRSCYEKELNHHPEMVGRIVLKWEIGEQGRVISTGTKSNELGDQEVADCVLAKLRTWRFPEPPPNQVAEVSYPFFFSN